MTERYQPGYLGATKLSGINIGDIIVEGDDIYGKRVNVAALLEGLSRRLSGTLSHRR
jgi:class 3 adenylate cyclase